MSKPIKVNDEDWAKLLAMQAGGETFANVVHRLLALEEGVKLFIAEVEKLPSFKKYRIDRPEMGAKEGG